jgi:DNA polymerase
MAPVRQRDLINWMQFFSELGVEAILIPTSSSLRTNVAMKAKSIPKSSFPLSVGKPARDKDLFSAIAPSDPDLQTIRDDLGECVRCKLHKTRTNIVFGSGNNQAKVMFIGEAPGFDEDQQGLPFVGRAGQLLTKIIESIGFRREEVYIANIIKCRPPDNRNPESDEIASCQDFLFRQIEVIRPCIICALGTFAAQTLLQSKLPISQMRGQLMDYRGAKLIATFHPAYLLRNPNEKRRVWDDVRMLRAYYDAHCS